MVFLLWRSEGLFNLTHLYVYLNIGRVMAEGALYCMRVVGTQISRSHSAVWGPRFLLLFGLHVCNRWRLRVDHTVGLGPHLLYIL